MIHYGHGHCHEHCHGGSFQYGTLTALEEAFRQLGFLQNEAIRLDKQIHELSSDSDDIKPQLEDHINNTEVHFTEDEKEQFNNLLTNTINFVLRSDLDLYYTKEDIDRFNFLKEVPDYYITEEELQRLIDEGIISSEKQLKQLLSDYYTKTEIDHKFTNSGFLTTSALLNYYTKQEVDDILKNIKFPENPDTVVQKITYTSAVSGDKTYKLGTLNVDDTKYDILGYLGGSNTDPDNPDNPGGSLIISHFVTIFKQSDSKPNKPEGGTYNFSTAEFAEPDGWSVEFPATRTTKIWFTSRTFYSNGKHTDWGEVNEWFDDRTIIDSIPSSRSYPVRAFYGANKGEKVNTPKGGVFDVDTKTLTEAPEGWSLTTNNMINKIIYVSYKNYIVSEGQIVDETDWSTPMQYIDIQGILDEVGKEAEEIWKDQIESTYKSLNNYLDDAITKSGIAADRAKQAEDLLNDIENGELDAAALRMAINELRSEIQKYGWYAEQRIDCTNWRKGKEDKEPYIQDMSLPSSMMLNEGKQHGSFYYTIVRDLSSENKPDGKSVGTYYLVESTQNGTIKETKVCYSTTHSRMCLQGEYGTTEEDVLYCNGVATLTGTLNYVESLFSAIDGRFGITTWQSENNGETIKNAAVEISYEKIKAELFDTSTSVGEMHAALIQLIKDQIDMGVYDLSGIEDSIDELKRQMNATSFQMTPENIVLTAMGGTVKGGCSFNIYENGTEKTHVLYIGQRLFIKYFKYDSKEDDDVVENGVVECTKLQINNTEYAVLKVVDGSTSGDYYLAQKSNSDIHPYIIPETKAVNDTADTKGQRVIKTNLVDAEVSDVQSAMMQIVKDNIVLSVTKDGEDVNGATIKLSLNEKNESSTEITSDKIILNGSTIAAAIAAESLNIHNVTELASDGKASFGLGTEGATTFNTDGTGQIAGGLINWNTDGDNGKFKLYVNGIIEAEGGHISNWTIGQDRLYSGIFENRAIAISPGTIYCRNTTSEANVWELNRNGSGFLAGGAIRWDNNGKTTIGEDVIINAHLTVNSEDVTNALTASDIIVGSENNSKFCKDGSGWVANHNIEWDANGNINIGKSDLVVTGNIFRGATIITKDNFYDYFKERATHYVPDLKKCGDVLIINSYPSEIQLLTIDLPLVLYGTDGVHVTDGWYAIHNGMYSYEDILALSGKMLTIVHNLESGSINVYGCELWWADDKGLTSNNENGITYYYKDYVTDSLSPWTSKNKGSFCTYKYLLKMVKNSTTESGGTNHGVSCWPQKLTSGGDSSVSWGNSEQEWKALDD